MDNQINAVSPTPTSLEGETAAEGARFIIRALQWLSASVSVDTNREDIDDYQTLIELGLNALEREVETACRALSACRSDRGDTK